MASFNVDAKEFIPTLKVSESGLTLKLHPIDKPKLRSKIEVITDESESALTTFKRYKVKEDIWKMICEPKGLLQLNRYLYEGEPNEMALIRQHVIKSKTQLHKLDISEDEYCIYSGQNRYTNPNIITFSLRYYKDQPIPYMINFMGSDGINRIYEYNIKACKIVSECHIMKSSDGRKIRYVTLYNYLKKKKVVKVIDCDTEVVIQKEEIPFKY